MSGRLCQDACTVTPVPGCLYRDACAVTRVSPRHRRRATVLAALLSLGAASPSGATETALSPSGATDALVSSVDAAAGNADAAAKAEALRRELRGIRDSLGAADADRAKIEAEVAAIRDDRARLKQSLIDTTRRMDAAGAAIDAGQARLDTLTGSETAVKASLAARRDVLGEILAVLQRMGRAAPPALLVRPDDLLAAVHAAILLGAVLPQMRQEAEALADDLHQLVALREGIAAEHDRLRDDVKALEGERVRLSLLTDARQRSQGEAEGALEAQRARIAEIARQATSVESLIARVEGEIGAAQRAREDARKAEDARTAQATLESQTQQARIAASPFKDTARLSPAIAFADAKGRLPMPVAGPVVRAWGVPDGFGGTEKGLSFGARAGAPVSSPADGWVVFAAPYRSFGQLIIVNAGSGYHIVLAGMEKTSVAVGQFVLAGEPVGTMGNGAARAAAAIAIGANTPILYVEFRKDGSAIDPAPWWAQPDTQRVRG